MNGRYGGRETRGRFKYEGVRVRVRTLHEAPLHPSHRRPGHKVPPTPSQLHLKGRTRCPGSSQGPPPRGSIGVCNWTRRGHQQVELASTCATSTTGCRHIAGLHQAAPISLREPPYWSALLKSSQSVAPMYTGGVYFEQGTRSQNTLSSS